MADNFPQYPATSFDQAVDLTIFTSNQLGDVINGDATSVVNTESGEIPTLRKALIDNFYFKNPIQWNPGNTNTVFNQLYVYMSDDINKGWYYAPTATLGNPIMMGETPVGDANWKLYSLVTTGIPEQVFPWYTEITQTTSSIVPPYEFDTAIVTFNGSTLVPGKDYTIANNTITFTPALVPEPDAEVPDILFCYIGKVQEGDPSTNYVTYSGLASSGGASIIGTTSGDTLQKYVDSYSKTKMVSPLDFGGIGSTTIDNTQPLQQAITESINTGKILNLMGGPWKVKETLDLTNVKSIISDYTGRIIIDPTDFTAKHSRKFAVTFGNPDTAFGSDRVSHSSILGYLVLQSSSRETELSGLYIKGALMKFGSIRISGFNGNGLRADAFWDSVIDSISIERCGNITSYALDINPYSDTSNCLFIGRIQVEQAYHKQMYINAIRSVFGPIHAERLKILTTNDGTTGLPSGLTYQNTNITLSNSSLTQMILDAAEDTSAGTVNTIPSVRLNLYASNATSLQMNTCVVSSTYGQNSTISNSRFYKYYNPSYQVTLENCTVTRDAGDGYLLFGSNVFSAINCSFDTIQPDYGTSKATFYNCLINSNYSNTNTNVSGILFDTCTFSGNISNTGPTEVSQPTELRNCRINGTLTGAYQHRVIVTGGYIENVNLTSRAYVKLKGVTGNLFNYTGDRAFVTLDCQFNTVTAWGPANFGSYKVGQRTQRLGSLVSGSITQYVNTTDAGANFISEITLP